MLTHLAQSAPKPRKEPALHSIGSQAAKLVNTLESSTSPQTKPGPSSPSLPSISAAPTQRDPSKKIGIPRAGAGSLAPPPVSLPAALAADKPAETDRALEASLPPSVRTSKREIWTDRGTPDTGWDGELTAVEWTRDLSEADRLEALRMVDQSLTPMTGAECQKALAKMRYMTKVRNESTEDIRLTLMFYAEELRKYPGDVVREVLATQASVSPWWPAWSELKDRLDVRTAKRRRLHEALTRARHSPKPSDAKPLSYDPRPPPGVTPAMMQKAEAIVAERHARKRAAKEEIERSPEELERELAENKRRMLDELTVLGAG